MHPMCQIKWSPVPQILFFVCFYQQIKKKKTSLYNSKFLKTFMFDALIPQFSSSFTPFITFRALRHPNQASIIPFSWR